MQAVDSCCMARHRRQLLQPYYRNVAVSNSR